MTREEKLAFCKGQYLYGNFFNDYKGEIEQLYSNASFMRKIHKISSYVEDSVLFGENITTDKALAARFQMFKNKFCDDFYNNLPFSDFPEYKKIYYAIKENGYAGKSATISLFYAMVYLDVLNGVL